MAVIQKDPELSTGERGPESGEQTAPNAGEDVWDEERIERALNTVKEMHIQVSY
jgi:hypothetical protein